jgi:hypothetical protein
VSESKQWIQVGEVTDAFEAEMLRGLLEAQGISVVITQEGAGKAIGITGGRLGSVEVYVAPHQAEEARKLLADYFKPGN